mmetsp:Transcript_78268/g.219426  ORF Transcript_78268/g.219426 Transcript_78268/m.219426 type:complete len:83 (+) Transcript_78268:184-432(+)
MGNIWQQFKLLGKNGLQNSNKKKNEKKQKSKQLQEMMMTMRRTTTTMMMMMMTATIAMTTMVRLQPRESGQDLKSYRNSPIK